jgi:uncharacterized protein YbaR (Trm112 family)/SAM-dependent methyltransferase
MHTSTLDILRCPYCGGRLEVVSSLYHRSDGEEIHEAVLGCDCCVFPVVAGIPVLHLQRAAVTAREHLEAGRPALALRSLVGLSNDEEAARFETLAAAATSTYRETVEALGPAFEGGYFLYRFSDPTYIVAHAVVRAVAGTVLHGSRRAVDVCGGSGHLTRTLMELSSPAPVLADLYFAKAWLARRFTAPGCEAVCCDGNAPLPFARGAFAVAICSDAFQYIWTKRQLVAEMVRLADIDRPDVEAGAVVISHTHNQLAWSPSHGQPLRPAGYRTLFETIEPRLFAESALLADVVKGGPLDLSRHHSAEEIDRDPALTIVATRHPEVFCAHALEGPTRASGEFRINPLYEVRADGERMHLRLRFPSPDYEEEYGACRQYLPEEVTIDAQAFRALEGGGPPSGLSDLIRRRIIVHLPRLYY